MKTTSSEAVSLAEVKDALKKREKESEELAYEQAQSLEHADKFSEVTPAKAKKLISEIRKNEKIPEETAVKIVDIMPKHVSTLKAILIKDNVELSDEELEAIIKLLKK
jgi:DNA-directed RNA polymerase subunit F